MSGKCVFGGMPGVSYLKKMFKTTSIAGLALAYVSRASLIQCQLFLEQVQLITLCPFTEIHTIIHNEALLA